MVLRKKEVYTIITPLPSFIPRQLAVDILHSHGEVITLNPLVLNYKHVDAPRHAAADEYFSTWYEIVERVQIVPGVGKFGASKISFNACFHDLPWGLQTHVYAPLNIDMRNKYRICGNQAGVEPPEQPEIGLAELGAPRDGLYLREDIEIRCNITMVSTVKAQMKAASKEMIQRFIKKAELVDSGALQAMVEDGMMKTYKPQAGTYPGGINDPVRSPQLSPPALQTPDSPASSKIPYQVPRRVSRYFVPNNPGTSQSTKYPPSLMQQQLMQQQLIANQLRRETMTPEPRNYTMELPGDYYYQSSPHYQAANQPRSVELPTGDEMQKQLNPGQYPDDRNNKRQSQWIAYKPASYAGVH
ncbi:hypothetical protein GGR50DRAFT_388812 [Xylaria sp. CBS 124048]|nr:hypothetical protein GGR50DRAFT_388812 [Xylaria sp. CBS 124048]